MRNTADLLDFTRFLIAEKTSRFFRSIHLVRSLSIAQHRLASILRIEDTGMFRTYYDYTMTVDTPNYDLPVFYKAPVLVERVDGNFANVPKEVSRRSIEIGRSSNVTYDIIGKEIWFDPVPKSSTIQYRLWYTYTLPDLAYGQCPAGSTTSAVKLASTRASDDVYGPAMNINDYYNGVTFEITAGTALGEIFVVSDYVGSTRTITPVSNLSVAPVSGDTYASHIQVDEDLAEPLCLLAANMSKIRDNDGKYLYGNEFLASLSWNLRELRLGLSRLGEVMIYSVDGVA